MSKKVFVLVPVEITLHDSVPNGGIYTSAPPSDESIQRALSSGLVMEPDQVPIIMSMLETDLVLA